MTRNFFHRPFVGRVVSIEQAPIQVLVNDGNTSNDRSTIVADDLLSTIYNSTSFVVFYFQVEGQLVMGLSSTICFAILLAICSGIIDQVCLFVCLF